MGELAMKQRSSLLTWAGILSLVAGGLLLLFLAAWVQVGFGFNVDSIAVVLEVLLAIAGGVLALVGIGAAAPWLMLAAFVVGEVFGRLVYGQIEYGTMSWPGMDLQYFSDNVDYWGGFFATAVVLSDLAFFALVAAVVLALIAFFRGTSTYSGAGTQVASYSASVPTASGVPAGWYADPSGLPTDRYWDGLAWTEQTRPRLAQAPMPAPGYGGSQAVAYGARPANGMGTAALVMGILGIIMLPIVFSILAIIFGSVGIGRANRGAATNKGVAIAGLVLGLIGIPLGALIGMLVFAN
jgi:hypothetical protein